MQKRDPGAEIYACGHNHALGSKRTRARFPDPEMKKPFIWKPVVYVRSGSFQEYGGYAEAKNMDPKPTGSALIKLYRDYHLIDVSDSDKIGSGKLFK